MSYRKKKLRQKQLQPPGLPAGLSRRKIKVILFTTLVVLLVSGLVLKRMTSPPLPSGFPALADLTRYSAALRELIKRVDAEARSRPHSEAVGKLGMAYHANLIFEPAKSAYQVASQLEPDDYRWYYYQALLEEDSGHLEGMAELLKKTMRLQPNYYPASRKLADLSFKQGRWNQAAELYAQIYSADSSSVPAALGLARLAARKQQWSQVIQYLDPVTQKYPLLRLPHQMIREAHQALGQHQRASEKERVLSRSDLTHETPARDLLREDLDRLCFLSTPLLKLAYSAQTAGDLKSMVQLCRRAVEAEPEDAEARYYLARALVLAYGNDSAAIAEAMRHRDEGLRLRPDNLTSLLQFAEALIARNSLEAAAGQLQTVLDKKPDHRKAHELMAMALTGLGKFEEAASHYAEVIRIRPDLADTHNNFGNLLTQQGKWKEALSHYTTALKLNPEYAEAHNNLGNLMARQSRWANARYHYSRAVKLKPDYAEALNNLGNTLAVQGDWRAALPYFSSAVDFNPNFAQAQFALGKALTKVGREEEAMSHFSEVLRISPDHEQARESLRGLEIQARKGASHPH
ncbi:MAG: tetratricopeptide repeat protein [Acidobacteria bacterium]|nr:tetratricopeptide repeat protein [Acidobacteriota bacterium]